MVEPTRLTNSTDANMKTVTVAGHTVAVVGPREERSGPNVAFIHGITSDMNFWGPVLPTQLSETVRWSSISLPGHFPSTVPADFGLADVSSRLFADCIGGAIRELYAGERVHLVGWSTGGFGAMVTAARFPNLVASVTSISGFARGKWGGRLGNMQMLAQSGLAGRLAFRAGMTAMAVESSVFEFISACCAADPDGVRLKAAFRDSLDLMWSQYSKLDFKVMCSLFAGLRRHDASTLIRNLIVPTLVIGGTNDPIIPIAETRYVASLIQNSELVELKDCGHLFYCEAQEEVWARVTDWILQHHG